MRQNKYGFWKGFIPVVLVGAAFGLARSINTGSSLEKKLEVPKQVQVQAKPQNLASQKISPKIKFYEKTYSGFIYPKDLPNIIYTANRVGVEPELLMAVRMAENGGKDLEFGIIPTEAYRKSKGYKINGVEVPYRNTSEKQASWSAWTIKRNRERFEKADKSKHQDFIDYLGDKYAPKNADNDPNGLNRNWKGNVRKFYNQFKGDKK